MAAVRRRWSVYLVRTGQGALYTGIALDVHARLSTHREGRGAKALRGRGPLELAFAAPVGGHSIALRLEARIKRLPKAAKEQLVRDGLPRGWLAASRRRP
jgi:putative endonuclease